jgi:hypothetical protein
MTMTALPPAPSTSDPVNFAAKADALVAALPLFVTQANALGTPGLGGGQMTGALDFAAPVTIAAIASPGPDIAAAISNIVYLSGTTTVTVFPNPSSGIAGVTRIVKHTGVHKFTNSFNLKLFDNADYTYAIGDVSVFIWEGANVWNEYIRQAVYTTPVYGQLNGFVLSNSATNVLNIGPGQATDTTGLVAIKNLTAWTKSLASWSAGNGGGALDAGTTGGVINTWYHWYTIKNLATGATDYVCSINGPAIGPTLPSGFTVWQWLYAWLTDGSKNWVLGTQTGDDFTPSAVTNNVTNSTALGTTPILQAVTVPSGISVKAKLRGYCYSNASDSILISSPLAAAVGSNATTGNNTASTESLGAGTATGFEVPGVITNTTAQIRAVASANTIGWSLATVGWARIRN